LVGEAYPLGPVGYRVLNLEYPVIKGVLVWPAGHPDCLQKGIELMELKDRFRSLSLPSPPPLKGIVPKVAQVRVALLPLLPSFPPPEVRVPQLEVWVSRAEVYLVGVPRAPMALVCPPQEAADVSAHPDEVVQELAYLLVVQELAYVLVPLAPGYAPVPLALGYALVPLAPAYVPPVLVPVVGV